ncbi:MAG: hypothetical protein MJ179_03425 [Treponema sp.]|nr:hypothetical protein [Treponema sp.]
MEDRELTPEEKKMKIEAQKRKRNTNIFLFFTVIIQIVVTLAIIIGLFVVSIVLVSLIFGKDNVWAVKIMNVLMFTEFIGGLILGFIVFSAIVRLIIRKFHLEDKLTKEVLDRYKKVEKK